MPFSHNSHSGQFCPGRAKNTLEEMVQTAISVGMRVFALTEHMPRDEEDFYPEEVQVGTHSAEDMVDLMDDFYSEACRLRMWYGHQIKILIGFESEWIRKSSLRQIRTLQSKHDFDFFIGSIHHVHTIPIDYDRATYEKARKVAGGTDQRLFEDYFDAQYEMLKALEPQLVGNFDLIRLYSDKPDGSFKNFDGVWEKIIRNLRLISRYGGILELSSAALRKGLKEPYPCMEICKAWQHMGGRFALSDDSHCIDQIATNYIGLMKFISRAEITSLCYLNQVEPPDDDYDDYDDLDITKRRWPKAPVSCICIERMFEEAVDDSDDDE